MDTNWINLSLQEHSKFIIMKTGEAVINHRGTAGMFDWFNNAAYMYGGEALYKLTPRYQEAYYKQKQVEKKYGKENVITVAHSQGGLLAELVGKDSKEIITLNKATRPAFFPPKKHDNQTDIRSKCDISIRIRLLRC
jgi:alpha-beta hydrolase superfamily lysophospholipase